MLIGEYNAKITDKNRVAVPKQFREVLTGKLILSRGYEGCLVLLDEKRWNSLTNLITTKTILNLKVRDTLRFILGGAFEITLDSQGRFVLPGSLITYANLTTELVFLGLDNWIEVWDQEAWLTKLEDLSKDAADIAEKLLTEANVD